MRGKKLGNIMLIMCMVVSMFLGNSMSANAENSRINSVKITSLPTFAVGASIADAKATVEIPEGCIAESHWKVWDTTLVDEFGDPYEDYVEIKTGNFDDTSMYIFYVTFKAAEGYQFTEEFLEIKLADGLPEGEVYSEYDEDGNECYYWIGPMVSAATAIDRVEVSYPEKVVGNLATVDEIKLYSGTNLIANDNFEIKAYWECMSDNYEDVTGQAFEDGKVYQVHVDIVPKAGFYFASTVVSYMNGVEDQVPFAEPTEITLFADYSFEPDLMEAEVTGLPQGKAGEVMPSELGLVTAVEGYSVYVEWYDEDDNNVTGQKMESGKKYTAYIDINAGGYSAFSEEFVFIIDGVKYEPTKLHIDENFAQLILEYEIEDEVVENTDDKTGDVEDTDIADVAAKTGDASNMVIWMSLFVLSVVTIVVNRVKE